MTWDMHRRAGLLVDHTPPIVTAGQVAVISILLLGQLPIGAPVRVVAVIDEPTVHGFAYGTLPGHPESGEERFLIHHDTDDTAPPSAPTSDQHAGTPSSAPHSPDTYKTRPPTATSTPSSHQTL